MAEYNIENTANSSEDLRYDKGKTSIMSMPPRYWRWVFKKTKTIPKTLNNEEPEFKVEIAGAIEVVAKSADFRGGWVHFSGMLDGSPNWGINVSDFQEYEVEEYDPEQL